MLDGKLFVVGTREVEFLGLVACAFKVSRCNNLVSYAKDYKFLNICKTWQDAQKLADIWNQDFRNNGSQRA